MVRVATFNIRTSRGVDGPNCWRRRRDACVAAIRELDADVVGLQEARPDQLADIRCAFPDTVIVGAGRDKDGGGEHAAVLVRGWTVETHETRWLSPTPSVAGSKGWDADLPRIATLVRLRRGDTTLGIANTHFDHMGAIAREEAARLLVDWLIAAPEVPWVVLGDLNDVPGSPPTATLAEAGFTDALPAAAGGTEHAFTGAFDRKRIDYVFAGPGVRVTSAGISNLRPGDRLPSDHWPVWADLALTSPAPSRAFGGVPGRHRRSGVRRAT
jgi:endonuclease/exonuclease/phosphatase family metal-dependent hydrolase